MKDFLIFTLTLLAIYCADIVTIDRTSSISYEWFSFSHTNILRGFAIFTVLWGHSGKAYGVKNIQWIAGIGVAMFLIISGYGVSSSLTSRGVQNYWKNKIFKVFIPYWIVFLSLGLLWRDSGQSILNYISVINGQWYIGYLLICYAIFWIVVKVCGAKNISLKKTLWLFFLIFGIWFIIDTMWFTIEDAPFLRARQMLSFPLGITMAYKKEELKRLISRYWIVLLLIGLAFMGITNTVLIKNLPLFVGNLLSLFTVLPMAVFVLYLSVFAIKLFNSRTFELLGKISFEAYLIQYFFYRLIVPGKLITIFACFAAVLLLAVLLHYGRQYVQRRN